MYKILSNILLSKLTSYAEEIIGDHQCGFWCNRLTTDHVFCICQILEKKWEYNEVLHVCDIFMEFYNLSFVLTGQFFTIVVLVRIHRPFLLINLSHQEVVPAKSVIDISVASLLASIKIIFVETAIPFFLWSIIQFLTYSSSFGHLGAHERKVCYD